MSKYHSVKVKVNGMTFDSRKEANRYCELKLLQQAGKITDLRRQVRYLIIPTQYDETGEYGEIGACLERSANYTADFVYHENGKLVVEDVKGMKTDDYILRRKLMLQVYGIRIKEV